MKTAYSTFSSVLWQLFKKDYHDRSDFNFSKFTEKGLFRVADQDKTLISWTFLEAACLFLWKFRQIKHYFLAPGIADFCISSVKEFSPDYSKRFPNCDLVDAPSMFATIGGHMPGGFAVHFPSSERFRSIVAIPKFIKPEYFIRGSGRSWGVKDVYYIAASNGECGVLLHEKEEGIGFEGVDVGRLLFGLSLYMDAFPDAVVEAGSESVHQIKHYAGARHIVNRNEIIDEEHRNSVSPHWRRGHFRLLSSEKFIRKQGQTIYIRGTFVKGRAFDVLDDAPAGRMNEQP
jgi:hypothetical protein